MTAKVKREKNTITLPDSIVRELGDVEYYTIVTDEDRIILTPSRPKPPPRADGKSAIADLCGKFEGWISDDFNEPMEEFKEYM